MSCARDRLTPIASPKSIHSSIVGLRASGNGSARTTVPAHAIVRPDRHTAGDRRARPAPHGEHRPARPAQIFAGTRRPSYLGHRIYAGPRHGYVGRLGHDPYLQQDTITR